MNTFNSESCRRRLRQTLMYGICFAFGGVAYAQFGSIDPVLPYDPYFGPTTEFPDGQHWIKATQVHFAWSLVGYGLTGSPPVDLDDPSRVIAVIDTGIDLDHVEFGGPPGTTGSKIHSDSRSFLEEGSGGIPSVLCPCETALFAAQPPEDTVGLLPTGGDPHGTLVAAYSNEELMAGVCWDCGILVLRVLAYIEQANCPGETETGTLCIQTAQTMADAIKFAAGWDEASQQYRPEPRARIISISAESQGGYTGLGCEGHVIADAIDDAVLQGCIIVAIAGNENAGVSCWTDSAHCGLHPMYDEAEIMGGIAINRNTIAVGGVCLDDESDNEEPWWHCRSRVNPLRSTFSDCCPAPGGTNYCNILYPVGINDPEPDRLPVLSVVAPMAHIFGTWSDGVVGTSNDDLGYAADGTSFVAPQIAGIIGLMLRVNPDLTFWQVRHILQATATDLKGPGDQYVGYDRYTGHGLVNARKAVEYVQKHYSPGDWDGDGLVAPIDAVLYVADFALGEPTSDLTLDGAQNTDDMTTFLDSYNGGQ